MIMPTPTSIVSRLTRRWFRTRSRSSAGARADGPFFSVVIAAYNPGERILPTIKSVLRQTYPNYEILVIGDGCTDATGEILAAHFGKRVRWKNLRRNRGSQSFPNNKGIRLARGTHIAYLNHDDIWSPQHLQVLVDTIAESDPDFAVSGAIYHPPDGTDVYYISGLFDDSSAGGTEFFPPSSFAHRRSVPERIGKWGDPMALSRPVDADFLRRAAAAGCSFASTRRITVHKFAAIHRYLFYRFPSSAEQEAVLAKLADPGFETNLLVGILRRAVAGAVMYRQFYADADAQNYAPGAFHRLARGAKGLELSTPVAVEQSMRLPLEIGFGSLDWHPAANDPTHGSVRWAGPNPNPGYFLNVRISRPFSLRIHIPQFANAAIAQSLRLKIGEQETAYQTETTEIGTFVLVVRPTLPLPIEDGFRIVFETRLPGSPLPDKAFLSGLFALAGFEVVLD